MESIGPSVGRWSDRAHPRSGLLLGRYGRCNRFLICAKANVCAIGDRRQSPCLKQKTLKRQADSKRLDSGISKHIFQCFPYYRTYSRFPREWIVEFRANSGSSPQEREATTES